ncbi:MAG: RHS famlily protein, partial [Microcystis aeruginosa G11-04]|nr:RHS famlily protein [Microcystis aeruginosa G11-04]
DYWLVMQGNGAESWTGGNNDYKLRIVTPQLNTAPMTIGTVISGSISETGEQDYYTFEGTAGQRLFFDSLVNTNNTYVYLTAPSGKIIVNGHHSRNNLIDIVLDESGTYRLAIDGSGETTENYGFRLLEYGAAFSLAKSQANSITLNTEITGSFDDPQQRESDFYRFNSSAGQYLYIDVLSGDSPNGWTIFRPNGDLLISGYIYEDKEISLSDTGEYTLEVWGNGSGNRNYKLKLITPELNTVAYTLGTTVSNTISQKGEQDTYTFAGNAGQWLYLDILNGNSNLKARLYSPTGVLEVDGDTNTDWTPRLLKETGTYRLVIDGAGETTGNYSFVMRERAQASTITLGTTLSEQINQTNGVKLYQITGQTGQVLNFNYLGQILTPKIDPATGHAYVLTDLPGTWTEVQSIAQGMGGNLVSINSAAENAFLVNQFGTYSFWIGLTDAAVEGNWKWVNGDPYTYTNWYPGEPNNAGNEDYAIFNWDGAGRWNDVPSNYSGYRGIVENNGTTPLRSQLWQGANWVLYDPSGRVVANPNANSPDFKVSLAASGTYTLAVISNSSTPVSYEFQVTDVSPTPVLTSGLNSLQSGSLNAGQVVNYNFTANAGTLVYLDSQDDSNWQVRYRLLNPDGSFVFSDQDSRYDRTPFLLSQSGKYTLQVLGYYSGTVGNYKFNLLELPKTLGSPAANYLEQGSTVSGNLNSGETKIYTFEGLENLKVMLNMMTTNGVTVSLYNPNGTQVFSGDYGWWYTQWHDNGLHTLTQDGKYHLTVSAWTGASRNYSFQFLSLAEAPEIAYGISEQGTLTPGQASSFYTLRGDQGDRLFFDIQSTNAPNSNYRWILYGPSNNAVFNQELRYNGEVTLPGAGQYYLYLQGGPDATPINYQFRVFNLEQPTRDVLTPGSGQQAINAADALGLFNVRLGVKDGQGGNAIQEYQIRLWPDPENGNPAIISSPETRFALDTKAYRYQLQSLDPDGDPLVYRLLDSPNGAFINGETGELLWFPETIVKPGDKATFTVEVNDRRGGFDQQTFVVDVFGGLGTIRGGIFDDLNGNGFRDTKLIRGDDPALIFTIDVSGSTAAPFRGKGEYEDIKTVVDAQVAAAQVLLDAIVAQGAGDRVKVGLILFGSDALIQDLDLRTPGLQQYITVTADGDNNGVRDFDQILKTLDPGMIPGGTDIHTALDKIDTLLDVLPGDPNFIFMSDGYDSEFDKARAKATVDDLKSKGGNITAFAIGEAATTENLEAIDPEAIQVIDFDELYNIFFGFDDRYAIEPWKEGVTVYLDLNNNQVLDNNEPFRVTKEDATVNTLGNTKYYYTFDNLMLGNYTVRVEVPNGSQLTAPPVSQLPIIDTVTVKGETFNHLFGIHKISDPPNQNPVFLSTPPTKVQLKAGQLLKYDADARDANGDPLTYQLTFAPEGMTIDPETGMVVWIPTKQQLEKSDQELRQINEAVIARGRLDLVQPYPLFNVLVTVKDGRGGTALQYLNVELLSDNRAPIFTSIVPENAIAQVGKTFRYQATAQDSDGDTLTYSLVPGAPTGISINPQTGLVTWTANNSQLGVREFTLKVTDGKGGEAQQIFPLTVNPGTPNQAPIITSIPRNTNPTGNTYFYQVQARDPDGDLLTYSLPKAPLGMTVDNNGLITWETNPAQSGTNNITLRVSDGQLFTEQNFNINLSHRTQNNPPIITSSPNVVTNLQQTYSYNLTGQDEDGDLLFWSLEQAPDGMVIDIRTGALRWLPQSSQLGQHQVIVKLLDSFGAFSTQDYTLKVNGTNTPPKLLSIPITKGAFNQPYIYTVVATDPENSPLSYNLGRKPNGMTIDQTGKIQWTPTQIGNYDIDVLVTDNQGATTTQTYQLVVGTQAINQAPNITSKPLFIANVGNPYQYQIQASDPDGQSLTYQLIESPQGMTINTNTGLVQWNTPITGNYKVVVAAFDSLGLGVTQGYNLTAKVNSLPVIRSTTPPTGAVPGVPYRYDIQATDPDGGILTYSLDPASQAKGITLDESGRLSWTPSNSQTGIHAITLTITDAAGGKVTQSFNLTVAPDTTAPKVIINRNKNFTNKGEAVSFQVSATDNVGIANLQLLINNTPVVIDSNGVATFTPTNPGIITAKAFASDAAGNKAEATTTVNVLDPTDTEAPSVSLDLSGIANYEITAPTPIKGSVNDTNLAYYALEVAPADGSAPFKEMFRGTTPVTNGVLGVLDPTLLPNDTYQVRLVAYDVNGKGNGVAELLDVSGDLKLGNFQLSFTDLEIPVGGIPITLTRTYNTLNSNNKDDFGYGWRMEFRDADVRTSLPKDELYQELGFRGVGFKEGDAVYITLPGGKREKFTFKLEAINSLVNAFLGRYGLYKPTFVADKGSTSTLSVETAGVVLTRGQNGQVVPFSGGSAFAHYHPQDWGNYYQLTTKEGIVYNIDATTGDINSITNRNSDKLTFTDAGITSSNGLKVTFGRDTQGRITTVTDPMGKQIKYEYDSKGDLIKVTDRENNTTQFKYNNDQPHYLDEIIDPLGRTGIKNEYDENGRLTKVFNGEGKAVQLEYNPDNFVYSVKDPLGNSTTYESDARGNIITEIDANGGIIKRTYDDSNNLLSETNPEGEKLSYTYDSKGNKLSETDALGNVTRYNYNSNNDLLTTTDALGNVTTNTYDSRGNLLSITGLSNGTITLNYNNNGLLTQLTPGEGTTKYEYDFRGNVTKEINPLGHEITYTYDGNGNRLTETRKLTTANGIRTLVTKTEYDSKGNIIKVTDAEGNISQTIYDAAGQKIKEIDALGRVTKYVYSEGGQLLETIYPDATPHNDSDNPRTRKEYDAANRVTADIDELGRPTQYQYDALGRLIYTIYPDLTPNDNTDNPRKETRYDKAGRVIAEVDERGNITRYTYDDAGRRTETILPDSTPNDDTDNPRILVTYDALGRQISQTDPLGRKTQFVYDNLGRPTGQIFADNTSISSTFDQAGRVIAKIDQEGNKTKYEYNALGQLTAVIDALNNRTEYGYDELENLITQKDAKANITKYEYDGIGRRIATQLPLNQHSTTQYDQVGNIVSTTDFNGEIITFIYDERNRLIKKALPNNEQVIYTYTLTGQRATETDGNGTITYQYDSRNRLLSRIDPDGVKIEYTYDAAGNRTSVNIPSGKTSYTFDEQNRLKAVTDSSNGVTTYTYDLAGNLIKTTLPNGTIETREYDLLNRLLYLQNSNSTSIINSFRYTLDKVGNRLTVVEQDGRKSNYEYDDLYRLLKEEVIDGTTRTISYTYDAVSNRLTRNDSVEGNTTYQYDKNDRLLKEVTNGVTTNYTYDNNGNTLSKTTGTDKVNYQWNAENRLVGLDNNGDGVNEITNKYDSDGIRISQIVNGEETRFLVDKNRDYAQVLEEYTPSKIIKASYIYGNDLISQLRNNQRSFYHVDGLGSTRALTDINGLVSDRYAYEAFGEIIKQLGNTKNLYLFAGEQRDPNLGLDYLRARYLDVSTGRFIRKDTYEGRINEPQTLNLYIYAHANPANIIDPTGLFGLGDISAAYTIRDILANIQIDFGFNLLSAAMGGDTDSVLSAGLAVIFPIVGSITKKVPGLIGGAAQQEKLNRIWGDTSSQALRASMIASGIKDPGFSAAHHIVAGSDKRYGNIACIARTRLAQLGISAKDPANGIFLNRYYHDYIHTPVYYAEVNRRILAANKHTVRDVLKQIGKDIQEYKFPF